MKNLKAILLAVLALCTVLCLGACGDGDGEAKESSDSSAASTVESNESSVGESSTDSTVSEESSEDASSVIDDGKVTYTATVVDENGAAIAGAMVQICSDACIPTATNSEGVATWTVVENDYKVSFLTLPAGYTYSGEETDFYFEDGEYDLTITLNSVSAEESSESSESAE